MKTEKKERRPAGDYIVIPAFAPDETLVSVVEGLQQYPNTDIIVVDDGSGLKYREIFRKVSFKATVLTHETNQGKGRALKTAFHYILEEQQKQAETGTGVWQETGAGAWQEAGAEAWQETGTGAWQETGAGAWQEAGAEAWTGIVVTADADGQHRKEDIRKILWEAKRHREEMTLGVRSFSGKVPLRSRFGNLVTSVVFTIASGVKLKDTQTGLRAFPVRFLPTLLNIQGERYEYEMNVLMEFAKNKIRFHEVPIHTVYLGKNESSHFHVIRDSLHIYWNILKFAGSSFASFLIDYVLFLIITGCLGAVGTISAAVVIANGAARLVSASCNFWWNRNYVFCHQGNARRAAMGYAMLAAAILCINTTILSWILTKGFLGAATGKLCVECLMFVFSFFMQQLFVFRKERNRAG